VKPNVDVPHPLRSIWMPSRPLEIAEPPKMLVPLALPQGMLFPFSSQPQAVAVVVSSFVDSVSVVAPRPQVVEVGDHRVGEVEPVPPAVRERDVVRFEPAVVDLKAMLAVELGPIPRPITADRQVSQSDPEAPRKLTASSVGHGEFDDGRIARRSDDGPTIKGIFGVARYIARAPTADQRNLLVDDGEAIDEAGS
jgi:hypothetical protein